MSKSLGDFEQLLLFAVLDLGKEAYGVAVRRRIEDRTGREISPGAVYTAMDRLEKKGFVESQLDDGVPTRGGRRKKFYTLAPEGARALAASYETLTRMSQGLLERLAKAGEEGVSS